MIRHALVVTVALMSIQAAFAQQTVSVSEVWNAFPDFVCKEKITSTALEKGKTKEQRVVESVFMSQRKMKKNADGVEVYSIIESRELTSLDRKPSPKDAALPTRPFFFDGLAANILFIADAPRHYVSPSDILEGRLTIRIGFTAPDSQEFLQLEFPASVSSVQFDAQSAQTLHLESRFGIRYGGSAVPVSADFQSIDIDGRAYWLPRLVKAEATGTKGVTLTYLAEYTECKKFEVKVQIRTTPDAVQ